MDKILCIYLSTLFSQQCFKLQQFLTALEMDDLPIVGRRIFKVSSSAALSFLLSDLILFAPVLRCSIVGHIVVTVVILPTLFGVI